MPGPTLKELHVFAGSAEDTNGPKQSLGPQPWSPPQNSLLLDELLLLDMSSTQ